MTMRSGGSTTHWSAMRRVAASSRRASDRPNPRQPGHVVGDLGHLLAGLERSLGIDPVDMADVESDQSACSVEDVSGRGIASIGVAHRIGEHSGKADIVGKTDHAGGESAVALAAMGHDLDEQVGCADRVSPAGDSGVREIGTAIGQGPADLTVRTQDQKPSLGTVLGDGVDSVPVNPLPPEIESRLIETGSQPPIPRCCARQRVTQEGEDIDMGSA